MPPSICPTITGVAHTHYPAEPYIFDGNPEHTFDLYVPTGFSGKRPLVVFIHGGGFDRGNKCGIVNTKSGKIKQLLEDGIAFATINYHLLKSGNTDGINICYEDCKTFIKYIRDNALSYNLKENKFAFWGESAGAGLSMLMGLRHAQFPFVKAIVAVKSQASYDLTKWESDVFSGTVTVNDCFNILTTGRVRMLFGNNSLTPGNYAIQTALPLAPTNRNKVDMLDLLSTGDPPLWIENNNTMTIPNTPDKLNHHLFHSKALVDRADDEAVEHYFKLPNLAGYGSSVGLYGNFIEFLKDKLI